MEYFESDGWIQVISATRLPQKASRVVNPPKTFLGVKFNNRMRSFFVSECGHGEFLWPEAPYPFVGIFVRWYFHLFLFASWHKVGRSTPWCRSLLKPEHGLQIHHDYQA